MEFDEYVKDWLAFRCDLLDLNEAAFGFSSKSLYMRSEEFEIEIAYLDLRSDLILDLDFFYLIKAGTLVYLALLLIVVIISLLSAIIISLVSFFGPIILLILLLIPVINFIVKWLNIIVIIFFITYHIYFKTFEYIMFKSYFLQKYNIIKSWFSKK